MVHNELKSFFFKKIDSLRKEIIGIGRDIYDNPELGFKEFKTEEIIKNKLESAGLEVETGLALTGIRTEIDMEASGPNIGIIGELDGVICHEHSDSEPVTGAVHACGHNVQAALMTGLAMAFSDYEYLENLAGKLTFLGVPAEEYIELGYREQLKQENKIKFFGGKQELISRGFFDDIDIVLMFHLYSNPSDKKAMLGATSNGFMAKNIIYQGKEAHAGAEPHLGINALNAAMLGMQAIHMQRETFKESDYIRVHPIITKGGDLVNIVPAEVKLETYVRGRTIEAILDANKKVDQALKAGALGVGAKVEIKDYPGYLPQVNNQDLNQIFKGNLLNFIDETEILEMSHHTGSSDIGDIMHILPAIHPYIGGAVGNAHARSFKIKDEELAYITASKVIGATIIDLLSDNAKLANQVINNFTGDAEKARDWRELW